MAERIEAVVTMKGIYSYRRPAYGYGMETAYIYNMESEDGTVYVWKTTSFMVMEFKDDNGWITKKSGKYNTAKINQNDVIRIKASIKGQSEYNGQPQTEVTRVKVLERIFKAETFEERMERIAKEKEQKKQEQLDTIRENDIIWRMPYRQYKEHYSDCETVIDSFERTIYHTPTIAVIIREGRLKASGVRGKHYSGYEFTITEDDGRTSKIVFRAISEETARKQLKKECGDVNAECTHIYHYSQW